MTIHVRTVVVLLSTLLVVASIVPSPALAQARGASGLPEAPGNPLAALQEQITALGQQMASVAQLGQEVATLGQQLAALQQQVLLLSGKLAVLTPSGGLGVFDAKDQKIGDVVGVQDSIPWVALAAGGQPLVLRVMSDRLVGGYLWYTGPGCSEAVYLSDTSLVYGTNVFALAAVQEPGGVVYASAPSSPAKKVSVRSVLEHDGTCYTYAAPFTMSLLDAAPVVTLDQLFSRPYSVR